MVAAKGLSTSELLVATLDEAFDQRAWHGPNLRGSIGRVRAEQAGWRAPGAGHGIAEIVAHCAYWKYAARRRLRGDKRGSFTLKGSNWFVLPEPLDDRDWKNTVALLRDEHATLREAVLALSPRQLATTPARSKVSTLTLIRGVAMHDVYHAGQIQVLKGVWKRRDGG